MPMKAGLSSFFDGNAIEDAIDQEMECPVRPVAGKR